MALLHKSDESAIGASAIRSMQQARYFVHLHTYGTPSFLPFRFCFRTRTQRTNHTHTPHEPLDFACVHIQKSPITFAFIRSRPRLLRSSHLSMVPQRIPKNNSWAIRLDESAHKSFALRLLVKEAYRQPQTIIACKSRDTKACFKCHLHPRAGLRSSAQTTPIRSITISFAPRLSFASIRRTPKGCGMCVLETGLRS